MPVKRRTTKRRVSAEREYEIWSECLDAGFDFFGDLPELGLTEADLRNPAHRAAREAWATYGPRFMAERAPNSPASWALEQFGEP